ncbi:MAG: sulfatase [Planctomycetaceae bacterium]|nr:sulfatase [Planctomycetaceae bacterium]
MDRRSFLKSAAMAGAAAGAMSMLGPDFALGENASGKKYNVLFIPVDDLRPQLGCYGHKQMKSPNIDALAGRGVLFKKTYCQVPVCGASRASLLTGLRPNESRFNDWASWAEKDAPGVVTLAKWFKQNGYHTVGNGKVFHNSPDCKDGWSEEHYSPTIGWPGYRKPESTAMVASERKKGKPMCFGMPYEADDCKDNEYPDGQIADKTIADLRRLAKSDKPFFIACGLTKPHLPFLAPKKYWDMYEADKLVLADNPNLPKNAPGPLTTYQWKELRGQYAGTPKRGPVSADLNRKLVHGYYACVSYIDSLVGQIIAELDKLGLRDNTIVILWGDHGWFLGEHGFWCKQVCMDLGYHAPMMISGPGIKPGVTEGLTEFVDMYPSLCDLAGIPQPPHLEGLSFAPLLQDPKRPWKKAIFSRYPSPDGDGVCDGRFVYTRYTFHGRQEGHMLYDHENDPKENVNVVADPKYADVVKRLQPLVTGGAKWWKVLPDGIEPPPAAKKLMG